jgi:hypothetical protein
MTELPVSYRREDFDKFLYSVTREEDGGASLTVLSLLARHDMDPWEAADQLTRVPWTEAAAQLSLLIATRPSDTTSPQVPDPIAIEQNCLGMAAPSAVVVRVCNRLPSPAASTSAHVWL